MKTLPVVRPRVSRAPAIAAFRSSTLATGLLWLLAVIGFGAASPVLHAQGTGALTTLHGFVGGSDGGIPTAALIQSTDGNFYGTTTAAGSSTGGTVFRLTPAGVLTTLYSFTGQSDGGTPYAGLVKGGDGNFYGTTGLGGTSNNGTVFRLTPAGVLTTLHEFSGAEGGHPTAALIQGGDGNFYGTTSTGGTDNYGTVFKITSGGALTVLHSFSYDNNEGQNSKGALVQTRDGALYGTTEYGGAVGNGTVFRLTPDGVLTTLHSFTGQSNGDGAEPVAGLVQGSDGNFYGTTEFGGTGNGGTVFRLTPAGVLTTLYSFTNGNDGDEPYGGLVQGSDGNFYGTTSGYGSSVPGTVFRLTPDGVLTSLYSFANQGTGLYPRAGLVQGSDGSFYGTTYGGGGYGNGTLFKLTVNPPAHPAFFAGEVSLGGSVYYLAFPGNGNVFGYYNFYDAADSHYLYHYDLGFEYVFDLGNGGIVFYDFASNDYFYTSPTFAFPYLYDFGLQAFLYYYPDPSNPGHYNTNGVRYFYNFSTGKIISK